MKKHYIKPVSELIKIEVEATLATSFGVNDEPTTDQNIAQRRGKGSAWMDYEQF